MLAGALLAGAATSCSSFLDTNTNPNSLTVNNPPTPALVLGQALNNTASNYSVGYNPYASFAVSYWAKSSVVSGYAEERTYNYTSNYNAGLFSGTYDNLNDYQYIQTQGTGGDYAYHAAVARIMKAYNFLLLVDQYGDIPYFNALKGRDNLTPTYDRAQDIYADLLVQLKGAIADINATILKEADQKKNNTLTIVPLGAEDVVFRGGGTTGTNTPALINWKRFANSLQLRILLRESQTKDAALNASVAAQLATLQNTAVALVSPANITPATADGFITADVGVNPGYLQSAGQQNPLFSTYGLSSGGGSAGTRRYQLPTVYLLHQYIDNKDPRVSQNYAAGSSNLPTTVVGSYTGGGTFAGSIAGGASAGYSSGNIGSFFQVGTLTPATGPQTGAGILKGLNAPTPLMLLSEQYFNKAEAESRSLFTGGDAAAATDYNSGVLASFLTTYRVATTAPFANSTAVAAATPGYPQYTAYMTNGANNKLVNFSLALTTGPNGSKQAIILFQKYLSENTLASIEALDDYRRTGLPAVVTSLDANPSYTGKGVNGGAIPYRLYYPQSEINTNNTNLPQNVNQFSKIFWQN